MRWTHAVAGNPAAPSDVLLRVLATGDEWAHQAVVGRTGLSPEVEEVLLHHPDRRFRNRLAESWTAAPELRARLLEGPDAENPVALAAGPLPYRTEVPPLPDWAYERLLSHPRPLVRHETAFSPTVPAHVVAALWDHEEPLLRRAACRTWDTLPEDVRRALLADPDATVRRTALSCVYRDDEAHTTALVEAYEADARWRLGDVLIDGRLARPLAERMVAERVHLASLALNPTFPADLAAPLATDPDPAVRRAYAARPGLTEAERAAVAYEVGGEDRLSTLGWVWDARDDADVLRACATSAHLWLRRSAAVCPGLPADLVELLAGDADFAVRLLLAENHPEPPPELLLDLYLNGEHRSVVALARRPGFPLAGVARSADPRLRRLAVNDPGLAPAEVERLSHDPDEEVRCSVAPDARLSPERVRELLAEPGTCGCAARNPLLTADELHRLLDEDGVARPA